MLSSSSWSSLYRGLDTLHRSLFHPERPIVNQCTHQGLCKWAYGRHWMSEWAGGVEEQAWWLDCCKLDHDTCGSLKMTNINYIKISVATFKVFPGHVFFSWSFWCPTKGWLAGRVIFPAFWIVIRSYSGRNDVVSIYLFCFTQTWDSYLKNQGKNRWLLILKSWFGGVLDTSNGLFTLTETLGILVHFVPKRGFGISAVWLIRSKKEVFSSSGF